MTGSEIDIVTATSGTPRPQPSAGFTLAALAKDPRTGWPPRARRMYEYLAARYGDHDALCTLAAAWIAHQRSEGVRKTYSTNFRVFEPYLREHGIHPLTVGFLAADAFARHLETAPTLVWRDGRREPEGPPRQDATRHNVLASCSSFYEFVLRTRALPKEAFDANPFTGVLYPVIDPLETTTVSLSETEWTTLLATARDNPISRATALRTYVLLWFVYVCFLRIDAALTARIENIGHTDGHRTIRVRIKGGKWATKALPPPVYAVLTELIGDRTEGFVFITSTGRPLDEPSVWRTLRKLARRAGLPQADRIRPHSIKHTVIEHAFARPGARPDRIQEAADHRDPRTTMRYHQRRKRLDDSPMYDMAAATAAALEES
ncbi:tyrosine-type recombinase/integrase [Streptomyces sp. NBC_01565]|uniref:tyrosine-type recombinase/integrase n=1 Tax=Streptomyces sp. NBC_01565 TaxID=2975881 RepID=UPI00225386CE|nr:tyrosine-type recombinase/integrase [Streptomyces sp. NBC_01565]MCX4546613.1 tyrosine-type recombinase/integrase [Streptomyces sp. NBC_01565]